MYPSLFLTALGAAPALASALYVRDGPAPPSGTGIPTDPYTIRVYKDGNCETGVTGGEKEFSVKDHDLTNPLVIDGDDAKFKGAEALGAGGSTIAQGFDVFFGMGDPPPGCKTIIMTPWAPAVPPPDSVPGKQLVQASTKGCHYAHIPPVTQLLVSQCCGAGCNNATLDGDKPHEDGKDSTLPQKKRATERRWTYEGPPPPGDKCSFADLKQTNGRAGPQRKITNGVSGASLPTTWTFQQQISFTMTSTSSTDQTITTSNGQHVDLTAGASFLGITAQVTTEMSKEWSQAVATSSGKDTSQGNVSSISVALQQPPGTANVFVSFIPKFICFDGPSKCSNDTTTPWHNCFPAYLPDGKTLDGEYGYVTVT